MKLSSVYPNPAPPQVPRRRDAEHLEGVSAHRRPVFIISGMDTVNLGAPDTPLDRLRAKQVERAELVAAVSGTKESFDATRERASAAEHILDGLLDDPDADAGDVSQAVANFTAARTSASRLDGALNSAEPKLAQLAQEIVTLKRQVKGAQ